MWPPPLSVERYVRTKPTFYGDLAIPLAPAHAYQSHATLLPTHVWIEEKHSYGTTIAVGQPPKLILGKALYFKPIATSTSQLSYLQARDGLVFNGTHIKPSYEEVLSAYGSIDATEGKEAIHIDSLETSVDKQGLGTALVNQLKSQFDIIEVAPLAGSEGFYSKLGFVQTPFSTVNAARPIWVYIKKELLN